MRKYLVILFIIFLTHIGVSYAAPPPMSGGGGGTADTLTTYTVATLPTGATGKIVAVSDGADATDCTTGSGSTYVMCIYNGAAWVASGQSTSGGDVTSVGDCATGACTSFTIGGVLLGDTTPSSNGAFGYGTNEFLWYANSEDFKVTASANLWTFDSNTSATFAFTPLVTFVTNPRIYDGDSHYLTLDAKDLTGNATVTIGGDTNNLYINNGTAILDIAAAATVNVDTSLTVNTAAVTLVGKSGGSTLTLPTAISLDGTLTNGKACTYASSGTVISCNTDYQGLDATLTALAALTIADASIIEGTGTDAFAVVTSGGNSRVLASKSDNSALEFTAITNAHITANTIRSNELAATLTFSDGDLIDLSGITQSSDTNEGLILPTWANVSTTGLTNGAISWDESSSAIKVKGTSGWVSVGATAAPVDATFLTLSSNATLSGERVLTEGLAIDFVDGGANSTLTIAFDPTELTGDRTWAAGGAATNTWTWNVSTGTDPSITFGNDNVLINNTLTSTKLITANAGVTIATGQAFKLGANTISSGDLIDGTKVANADLGDIGVSSGVWSVEDDSHAHTSSTITLASTNLSDTSALAYLAGTNTFTANNVFGNGDTDTLTIRSMIIGGNSRAVQIAASVASPTYATGTNELYVAGDVEAGGNMYASAFVGGAGTDGQRGLTLTSNTALTPTADQIYFINDVLYFSQAGTQKTPMRLEDAQTASGLKTFSGGAYFGDASTNSGVRFYDGSSNYWTMIAPTGMSTNPTFKLPSAQGASGTYLYDSDGAGTLAWGTPTATAHGSDTYIQFNDGGTALGSDAGFTFAKSTSTLTLGKNTSGGEIVLYNELGGTDYNATIQPNASQAAAATITLPSYTTTLLGSGANTFTGLQAITAVNAAGGSADVLTLSGTLGAFDGTDTFRGIYLNYTNANHTSTGNTVALIDVPAITGDANSNFYGIRFGNFTGTTGAASEVEYAISIGTGFDRGVSSASPLYVGDGTNGTTISATGGQSFAGSATFTAASATSSVPWVVGAGTAANTAEGTAYWESDTDMLTIGDGATGISLDFTANTVITFPTTTATLARTDAGQTFTGVQVFTSPTITTAIAATTAGASTVGTAALPFSSVYIGGAATNNVQLTATSAAARSATIPDIAANSTFLVTDSTTTSAGKIPLSTTTAGKHTYSTPTYPTASGTSRKMLVADGTNVVYSTELWPIATTSGNIMVADGTNWVTTATTGTGAPVKSAGASITPQAYDGHAAASPTAAQLSNAIVNNYGQAAADVSLTGPTPAAGMNFIMIAGTARSNYWRYTSNTTNVYLDGGTAVTYVGFATPAVGNAISCFSFQTGAGPDYSLKCTTLSGTSTSG
jgi:hypothetical protein